MALGNQVDFEMHSADDRTLQVTIQDAAGVAVNITGASMKWAISKLDESGAIPLPKSETAILQKEIGAGITIINAPQGRADVALVPDDTVALRGVFYHELELTLGGLVSTVIFGKVTIYRDLIQAGI